MFVFYDNVHVFKVQLNKDLFYLYHLCLIFKDLQNENDLRQDFSKYEFQYVSSAHFIHLKASEKHVS